MAAGGAEKSVGSEALLDALSSATCISLLGGGMVQQVRSLLAMDSAEALGGNAKDVARQNLASAASLGSFFELFVGPLLGRLSDRLGRRPVFLFYAAVPTVTRFLSSLPQTSPGLRLRFLYLDICLLRACGVQAMMSMGQTMITDVTAPSAQTRARSILQSALALGVVLGSYTGGKLGARHGPRATYMAAVVAGALAWVSFAARLPETLKVKAAATSAAGDGAKQAATEDAAAGKSAAAEAAPRGAFRSFLADPECRCLTLALALHEFANLPQINEVHVLFVRETLNWGAEAIGAFASLYGVAGFVGARLTSRLEDALGSVRQVTLSHVSCALAFLLWGTARGRLRMAATLPALMLSMGRGTVLMNKLMARAAGLGLGRGEAMGVLITAQSLAKTAAPVALMRLFDAAKAPRARGSLLPRFPAGAPLLFVAFLSLVSEALHRSALGAARARQEAEHLAVSLGPD